MTSRFPTGLCGLPSDTVPRFLAITGSSSRRLHPLFRVHPASHLPALAGPYRLPTPSMRFLFSFATSTHRVHKQQGSQTLASGPPAAFLTLSTGYPSVHLVGLFHPTATSKILSSGAFPGNQLPSSSLGHCPHSVRVNLLHLGEPKCTRSRRAAYKALLRLPIRCPLDRVVTSADRPIPS